MTSFLQKMYIIQDGTVISIIKGVCKRYQLSKVYLGGYPLEIRHCNGKSPVFYSVLVGKSTTTGGYSRRKPETMMGMILLLMTRKLWPLVCCYYDDFH